MKIVYKTIFCKLNYKEANTNENYTIVLWNLDSNCNNLLDFWIFSKNLKIKFFQKKIDAHKDYVALLWSPKFEL